MFTCLKINRKVKPCGINYKPWINSNDLSKELPSIKGPRGSISFETKYTSWERIQGYNIGFHYPFNNLVGYQNKNSIIKDCNDVKTYTFNNKFSISVVNDNIIKYTKLVKLLRKHIGKGYIIIYTKITKCNFIPYGFIISKKNGDLYGNMSEKFQDLIYLSGLTSPTKGPDGYIKDIFDNCKLTLLNRRFDNKVNGYYIIPDCKRLKDNICKCYIVRGVKDIKSQDINLNYDYLKNDSKYIAIYLMTIKENSIILFNIINKYNSLVNT